MTDPSGHMDAFYGGGGSSGYVPPPPPPPPPPTTTTVTTTTTTTSTTTTATSTSSLTVTVSNSPPTATTSSTTTYNCAEVPNAACSEYNTPGPRGGPYASWGEAEAVSLGVGEITIGSFAIGAAFGIGVLSDAIPGYPAIGLGMIGAGVAAEGGAALAYTAENGPAATPSGARDAGDSFDKVINEGIEIFSDLFYIRPKNDRIYLGTRLAIL